MNKFSAEDQLRPPLYLSWPVILISFIFWPAGLLLLIARLGRDRHASISTGRVLKIVGVLLFLICLVGGYGIYEEELERFGDLTDDGYLSLAVAGAFSVLGIILWRYGGILQYRGRMVREYLNVIVNKRFSDVDEISRIVGKPRPQVEQELDFLIEKRYLPEALLDLGAGRVVVPSVRRHMEAEAQWQNRNGVRPEDTPAPGEGGPPAEPVVVVCRSCGAQALVISGKSAVCEYCGSPLKKS